MLAVARRSRAGDTAVRAGLANARVVLANSHGTADRCRDLGARDARVVHLGTDLPEVPPERGATLVTVGHVVPRKRHADVLRALWLLREDHPGRALGRDRRRAGASRPGAADRRARR